MKTFTLRLGCVALGLLAPVALTMNGADRLSLTEQGYVSGIMVQINLPDGVTRTAKLEGVGCSARMSSRTAIKAE